MKRILLPLLIASPILSTLAPHANAGAITLDHGALRPQLLGPAAFHQRANGSVPTGAIRLTRQLSTSNDIVPTVFGNSLSGGTLVLSQPQSGGLSAGVIVTGAGTLTLSGSSNYFNGATLQFLGGNSGTAVLTARPSTLVSDALLTYTVFSLDTTIGPVFTMIGPVFSAGQTLTSLTILGTDGPTLNGTPTAPSGNLSLIGQWSQHDPAGALVWIGSLENGGNRGVLDIGNSNGAVLVRVGNDAPVSDGTVVMNVAPAAAPVPEPGSVGLLAIGALAAGRARRRR